MKPLWIFLIQGLLALGTAYGAATNSPALAARLAAVQKMAPRGFTVFAEPPFVVAGDEPATRVHQHALHTIRWAVDKLKQDFFQRDPAEVITVWLFKDEASYKKHTAALFHDKPTTTFGY